jgi:hypothetical protein
MTILVPPRVGPKRNNFESNLACAVSDASHLSTLLRTKVFKFSNENSLSFHGNWYAREKVLARIRVAWWRKSGGVVGGLSGPPTFLFVVQYYFGFC